MHEMKQTLKTINQKLKEYKVSTMQDELSCGVLIYNMVTIVNKTVLFARNLEQ